ncbi:putative quinone oxidoreductase [Kockovaella imperatae]|uniref:Putative quinone oxidoreductase n=1 Tax=Kockovaella imperatae TaxID=4999 RepID=A0A1Y1USV1_9TREE|nr:putative quinone oxidoreductase [Kockovaella imperatae]ORX40604.1 putative quinone oxidoreductase [Kockovaella imperatae]
MSKTMQAIAYTKYGGPEVTSIVSVPIPSPGPGQIQTRVVAGALNPVDWHQRNGAMAQISPYTFPQVAANEFSGIVTALGEGVSNFTVGDRVTCRTDFLKLGALGEYTVQPASFYARVPESLSLVDAAGLPLAGLTAEQGLDRLNVKQGDKLLVTGGAGGVGLFAIQLAKIRGAHVTTTASQAGSSIVKEAGADEIIDYKNEKVAEHPTKFDKVFDCAGGEEALINDIIPAVVEGGKITSVAGVMIPGALDDFNLGWKGPLVNGMLWWKSRAIRNAADARKVTYDYFFMHPDGVQLAKLIGFMEQGKLSVKIDSKYQMEDYAKAFEKLESGRSKGKIIIEMPHSKEIK